jgi:hypothetical protein
MNIRSKFNVKVAIWRNTQSGVPGFRPTDSWAVIMPAPAAGYNGFMDQLSGDKRVIEGLGEIKYADWLLCILPTDVTEKDRVQIDGGDVHEIYRIRDPNLRGHHLELSMKALPAGTLELMTG